jgi:HK97 family phage major capsid protein
MDIRELMRRRAELLKATRAMLAVAEREGRDLTAAEKTQFDRALVKIEEAGEAIRRGNPAYAAAFPARNGAEPTAWIQSMIDLLGKSLKEPIMPVPGHQRSDGSITYESERSRDDGLTFVTDRGVEVRALAARESYVEATRSHWPDWIEQRDGLRFGRFVRGVITGDWRDAEAERRAMATTDSTLGGYMLPSPVGADVIDLARADSVLMQAGALTVPMDSKTLLIARVTADPTPAWKAENAKATATGLTFGGLQLVAKMLFAVVPISLELVTDAPNASAVIENAMRKALGLELDRVGLFGSGAGEEPRGIYNDPDLGLVDMGAMAGAELESYAPFTDAIQVVREANGVPKAAIYSPRTESTLGKLEDLNHQQLQMPKAVAELSHFASTQIPNDLVHGTAIDASVAFVGDFSTVLYGIRDQVRVEVGREAGEAFERGQVMIRVYLRADVCVRRATHLCAIRGIIPPP